MSLRLNLNLFQSYAINQEFKLFWFFIANQKKRVLPYTLLKNGVSTVSYP